VLASGEREVVTQSPEGLGGRKRDGAWFQHALMSAIPDYKSNSIGYVGRFSRARGSCGEPRLV
jgi:hypothetical protein